MARRRLGVLLTHVALVVACAAVAFPLLFAVLKATQPGEFVTTASLRPGGSLLDNVARVWVEANLGRYMLNSLVVSVLVVLGKTTLSVLAALAFVYFRFPLRSAAFAVVLFTLMLPTDLLVVSLFDLVGTRLGWADTYAAIVVPFLASATGTFLFRQHFLGVPASLMDAARIDGCGPLRFLWNVLLPLSANAVGALAVIQFVYAWDQYLWPLVIMQQDGHQVVQVGLRRLIDVGGATDWGAVMAGAVVSLLPPLVVFTALQEQFSRGFSFGGDK